MRILLAIAWKEFLHIRRDPKTLAFIVVMPILLLVIYGYGISFDVENIRVAVVDHDRTGQSRQLIDQLQSNAYFSVTHYRENTDQLMEDIDHGSILVGMVIPLGFAADLADSNKTAQVQFLIDGSDGNTANIAAGYLTALTNTLNVKGLQEKISTNAGIAVTVPPVVLQSRFLYNPELNSSNFIVPGIIAIILMLIGSVATALTLVREKENNTIEQLVVSQANRAQIIFGKLLPYVVLSFLAVILVVLAALWLFNLPVRGSLIELGLMTLVYLIGVLGIGISISSLFRSMAPAMLASLMITLLPTIVLSGFVFPVRNMPEVLQWLSTIVPARYFLVIMRGLYLKDIGIAVLWPQLLFLLIFAAVIFTISILTFRRRLD